MIEARPVARDDYGWALALVLFTFGLYLASAGPTLVAFRDAGEMVSSVTTLGVLHPTSYPLYSLIGHCFETISLGDPAYRLNVFSALSMALTWGLTYLFLIRAALCRRPAALLAVALAAVSYHFWAHALISEMYAMSLTFMAGVLVAIAYERYSLAAFLFGLGCSNRSDLVLMAPAFGLMLYQAKDFPRREFWLIGATFTLGLSTYLYLPIRASTHPFLNWNDPSTLDRLIVSLFRLGYKGTLDVLSQSYSTGTNFVSEMGLYLHHLWSDFFGVGVICAASAVIVGFRSRSRWSMPILVGWVITGPLFIFLGNLPPNPHAVAIMQSGYLMPDLCFLILMAIGINAFSQKIPSRWTYGLAALLTVGILAGAVRTWGDVSKRNHYLASDFIRNVYGSLPPQSLVIARSDVPIFTLFYGHWGPNGSDERIPIAQGLAHSEWYQTMIARQIPGLSVSALGPTSDWTLFAQSNPTWKIFATNDIDWPDQATAFFHPSGLLNQFAPAIPNASMTTDQMSALYVYRGLYRYGAYRDFFSNELIEEYAKGYLQDVTSPEALRHALLFQPDSPYATMRLVYWAIGKSDWSSAEHYSQWSSDQFRELLAQADAWKSFTGIRQNISHDLSMTLCASGVAEERLGHLDQAKQWYAKALDENPTNADANFNLAVLYWKAGNWPEVVHHLQSMANDWPNDSRWKQYLPMALRHMSATTP